MSDQGWFKVLRNGKEIASGSGLFKDIQREADRYVLKHAFDENVSVRLQRETSK